MTATDIAKALSPDRRGFLRLVGAAAVSSAAMDPMASALAQAADGKTLKILIEPEPPVLMAVLTPLTSAQITGTKINEGLLSYDFEINPKPQLAKEWSVSEDGKEYVFKLQPNVKWHDDKDFTSADVAYSIGLLKEKHPRGRATFANIVSIETPDALTVVLKLSNPAPYMLYALAASESPMVAKHIFDGSDPAANPTLSAPVGTGPFMFKEWVRGSHILFERNPNFRNKDEPKVDRILFQFARDASARSIAVETGAVDVLSGTPVPVPFTDLPRLEKDKKLKITTDGWQYINAIGRLEFNLDNKYFKDLKVRTAVAHLLDRQTILKVACYGYGEVAYGPVSPDLKRFYVPELANMIPKLDVKKAEELLDEAGYKRSADGTRFSIMIDFMPNGDIFRRTGEYMKQALGRVGIQCTVRAQDIATYIKRIYTDRDFDCVVNAMNNTYDPTVGVQRLYWSKNFRPGVPYSNASHYSNPKVDALLEAASIEPNEKKRIALFREFQEIVVKEIPDMVLFTQYGATVFNAKVENAITTADGICATYANVSVKA